MRPVDFELPVDQIQFYLSKQAILHPLIYKQFVRQLVTMYRKGTVTPIPLTILEDFYFRTSKKVA